MVCNVKKRYQNLARKLENYHLRNFKLFSEQIWEHFSTEYVLEATALRCVCVRIHTCRHMHVRAPPAFAAPKDTTDWSRAVLRGKPGFSCGAEKSRLAHYIQGPSQSSWTGVVFPVEYSTGLLVYASSQDPETTMQFFGRTPQMLSYLQ